jgi:hypothetical protein
MGWAAELVCSGDGSFEVAHRVEGGVKLPNIGVLVQADANFYRPLVNKLSRWDGIIAVRERGKAADPRTVRELVVRIWGWPTSLMGGFGPRSDFPRVYARPQMLRDGF